uniref:Cell cycle checkpoint protein RAD1 n=1 Tax=Eptatretus burgeri TaxID=7764 RepID=A0A8C4R642_EPTBU
MDQAGGDQEFVFVAKLDNVRNFSNILRAVHFKDQAAFCVTANGIKVTVEDSKCMQANAFIQAGIFHEYHVKADSVTFRINLTALLGCLTIFGSSSQSGTTAMKMCYRGDGHPLVALLEDGGVLTDCKIKTQEMEDALPFDFCHTDVVNKAIMKAEGLREAFGELDMSSDFLEIMMSPDKPFFRLSTFGSSGSVHCDYPKDSDMMELFSCAKVQSNRYRVNLLKPFTKALTLSCKVAIRTDSRGLLSLQFMIRTEDGQICFVEFYCCPDEE